MTSPHRLYLKQLDLLFKAGGSTTVRGYAEESLSAGTILGVPVGGTDLLILNGEVRSSLSSSGSKAWHSSTRVTPSCGAKTLSLDDLAVGVGFGLRIATPLAPLRLDIGYPTTRRPGDKSYRFHFSIGQMF